MADRCLKEIEKKLSHSITMSSTMSTNSCVNQASTQIELEEDLGTEKNICNTISSRKQLKQIDSNHFSHYLLTYTHSPKLLPRKVHIQSSSMSKNSSIQHMNPAALFPSNDDNIPSPPLDQLLTYKATIKSPANASNSLALTNADNLCSKSNSHSKLTEFHENEEGKKFVSLNASYGRMAKGNKTKNFHQLSKSPVTCEKRNLGKKLISNSQRSKQCKVSMFVCHLIYLGKFFNNYH